MAQALNLLTDADLVTEFEMRANVHGNNVVNGEAKDATKSYWALDAVHEELRKRGNLSRAALTNLFEHPEMAVRYYAAKKILALEPHRARAVIEDVYAHGPLALSGDAGMTLWMLDEGTFKPT